MSGLLLSALLSNPEGRVVPGAPLARQDLAHLLYVKKAFAFTESLSLKPRALCSRLSSLPICSLRPLTMERQSCDSAHPDVKLPGALSSLCVSALDRVTPFGLVGLAQPTIALVSSVLGSVSRPVQRCMYSSETLEDPPKALGVAFGYAKRHPHRWSHWSRLAVLFFLTTDSSPYRLIFS